mmetsp:Transcript_46912/g.130660  ORF Transcript_46912/g.130660 Transcript_46912/m.130660 type:complete len:219 (-) Transcript_46912:23-679(-)
MPARAGVHARVLARIPHRRMPGIGTPIISGHAAANHKPRRLRVFGTCRARSQVRRGVAFAPVAKPGNVYMCALVLGPNAALSTPGTVLLAGRAAHGKQGVTRRSGQLGALCGCPRKGRTILRPGERRGDADVSLRARGPLRPTPQVQWRPGTFGLQAGADVHAAAARITGRRGPVRANQIAQAHHRWRYTARFDLGMSRSQQPLRRDLTEAPNLLRQL